MNAQIEPFLQKITELKTCYYERGDMIALPIYVGLSNGWNFSSKEEEQKLSWCGERVTVLCEAEDSQGGRTVIQGAENLQVGREQRIVFWGAEKLLGEKLHFDFTVMSSKLNCARQWS